MADPDFHFGLVETFSLIKRGLFELCKSEISYEKLGIEFIYNPVFVSDLVQHINSVVLSQGKKLEYIHIYITLWTLDNDNDDDDDDNHDNQDDSGNVNQGLNNDIITKNKYDNGHDLSKKKFSFDKRLAKHHAYFFKSKVIRYPLLTGLQVRAYSSVKLSPIFMPGEMSVSFDYLCSALDLNVRLNYNKCYNGDLSIVSKIFDATDNYSSKYFIFFFDTERVGVHNLIMFIDENIKLFGMTPVTSNVRLRFWADNTEKTKLFVADCTSDWGCEAPVLAKSKELTVIDDSTSTSLVSCGDNVTQYGTPYVSNKKRGMSIRGYSTISGSKISAVESGFKRENITDRFTLDNSALIEITNIINDFAIDETDKQLKIEELLYSTNLHYLKYIDNNLCLSPKTLKYL